MAMGVAAADSARQWLKWDTAPGQAGTAQAPARRLPGRVALSAKTIQIACSWLVAEGAILLYFVSQLHRQQPSL